jgi:DNA-directed RNA polymerase subunit beta
MPLLDFNDYASFREVLKEKAQRAVSESFPISNTRFALGVSDLVFTGPSRYTLREEKDALLNDKTLSHRLTGKYTITDPAGKVISSSGTKTILNVPYITDRGTFIRNGVEYTVSKQFRLTPNVYTRVADDGRIESQFNVKPRTGRGFRVYMDPETSVFFMRYGNHTVPLYPFLKTFGYPDEHLKLYWGKDILSKNVAVQDTTSSIRLIGQLALEEQQKAEKNLSKQAALDENTKRAFLTEHFSRMVLDPDATETTLGSRYANVTPAAIVAATKKVLGVARGHQSSDDRDSLEYQTVHDISDFLAEKIRLDQGNIAKRVLWNITLRNGDSSRIPTALFDKHNDTIFNVSGLGKTIEEINAMETFDANQQVVRLGEGGIKDIDSVPKEARNVQPSYLGFIDPVRSPEKLHVGVDLRFVKNVRKGDDNLLYREFLNPRTGKKEWVSSKKATRSIVGFPDGLENNDPFVPAIVKARGIYFVPRKSVDYFLESGDDMFSHGSHLVPLKSGTKAMRLVMGSKMANQALPLVAREAPYVQTAASPMSMEEILGPYLGAIRAKKEGTVKSVYTDHIKLAYDDGSEEEVDLYDNHPFARKTFLRNTPVVRAGMRISPNTLLATSNHTDDKGTAALGTNLRVAYATYHGKNFEDAVVISQSAAQKLTSEHLYNDAIEKDKELTIGKQTFRALYPNKFNRQQLDIVDDEGIIKPGTQINYGDPLFLAVRETPPGPGTLGRRVRRSEAITWQHPFTGVVTDVAKTRNGASVYIRANVPMRVGDKISGRHGNKGVVADIVEDTKMMKDAQGRVFDIVLHPLGVLSRTNSSQLIEAQLGKVVEKTGKPYILPGFSKEDFVEFAQNELKKNHLQDTEDIFDPETGKTIPKVFTGKMYFYKLSHTSESKSKARSLGAYTSEEQPAKGGPTGSKHFGDMEYQALLGHGALSVIKDLKILHGQKNDDFWRQLKLGQTPTMPGTPFVYNKFKALIRAAGVNLREDKSADHIFAMTNKQAHELTGARKISSADTYGATSLKPIPGGLFDPEATGSLGEGDRWGYVQLPEALPNPVMEEPLRVLLGLTKKEFDSYIAGDKKVNGKGGAAALQEMLGRIDFPAARANLIEDIREGSRSKRDTAVKKLGFLDAMQRNNTRPEDFFMDRVPVLPPRYRPISKVKEKTIASDPNYMYKTLLESIEDFNDTVSLPEDIRKQARKQIYDNYRALVGITDPQQQDLQQKRVGGILQQLFGKGSPKASFVQRRLLGTNIDISGLAVAVPNPSLKLNEVGLPESKAWDLYELFIIRNLVQAGYPGKFAAKAVEERSAPAYKALQQVITERPVLLNRAPTLHKYNIMAFWPVLTKGHTLQVSPTIVKPFNLDFDGDVVSYTVPISKKAVEESMNLMLPEKNLLGARHGKPIYVPANEYLQGIYLGSKPPQQKPSQHFATRNAALEAYRKGEISVDDPITIGGA